MRETGETTRDRAKRHLKAGRKNPRGLQTEWRWEDCSKDKPKLARG